MNIFRCCRQPQVAPRENLNELSKAKSRNLLEPYNWDLQQVSDRGYSFNHYFERDIDADKEVKLLCTLFTIAIDPEIENKTKEIERKFGKLNKTDRSAIFNFFKKLPPVMAVQIIRYCTPKTRRLIFQHNIDSESKRNLIFDWTAAALRISQIEKLPLSFLDEFYDYLPADIKNEEFEQEFLYEIYLNIEDAERTQNPKISHLIEDASLRQQLAIKRVTTMMQYQNTLDGPQRSVSYLLKDLQNGTQADKWLLNLFQTVPKKSWPFLFLFFTQNMVVQDTPFVSGMAQLILYAHDHTEHPRLIGIYNDYAEEKGGGHFARYFSEDQVTPDFSNFMITDLDQWLDIAVPTFMHLLESSQLMSKHEARDTIKNLYVVLCETKTLPFVIARMLEKEDLQNVIANLEHFASIPFSRDEKLLKCMKLSLKQLSDPLSVITDILSLSIPRETRSYNPIPQKVLWKEELYKDSDEMAEVAFKVVHKMKVKVLDYFNSKQYSDFGLPLVKSILAKDQEYAEQFFIECVNKLCESQLYTPKEKYTRLENLVYCYVTYGYNPIPLFEKCQSIDQIKKWPRTLQIKKASFLLSNYLDPKGFYPAVVKLLKNIVKEKHVHYVPYVFLYLNQMILLDDFIEKTHYPIQNILNNPFDGMYWITDEDSGLLKQLYMKQYQDTWFEKLIDLSKTFVEEEKYSLFRDCYKFMKRIDRLDDWKKSVSEKTPEQKERLEKYLTDAAKKNIYEDW